VFGGDGTVREVVKGMGDDPLPVGIIPFGTVNVLALDLGISFNPVIATATILEGHKKKIDVGYLNDEPFLLMVSTGLDALAVHNVDLSTKRYFGQIAYVISAIWSALTDRAGKIKITMEDQNIQDRGYLVIISNSRFYGGRYKIAEEIRIDDGLLNVILFKKSSITDTFRLLLGVVTNRHRYMRDIAFYKGREIQVTSRTKVKVQMDGDKAPPTPIRVWVKKHHLPVIVPRNQQSQEGLEAVKTLLAHVFSPGAWT
ncbi:unnamed protein product, partial [marine sediment metagenome]